MRDEVFQMIKNNKSIDLAIGMPDFAAQPQQIMDAMVDVMVNGGHAINQYTKATVNNNKLLK